LRFVCGFFFFFCVVVGGGWLWGGGGGGIANLAQNNVALRKSFFLTVGTG